MKEKILNMPRKRLVVLLFMLLPLFSVAQNMLVGSYNIRYQNGGDSLRGDVWSRRCQVICGQINFMSPDIFGAQEVLYPQLRDMLAALDGYRYIGVGRDDGKQKGEYAAIFYRGDRLMLLDSGNFWLSQTPERPSLGWDAACVRICSWGKFRARRSMAPVSDFYFFNLHLDHVGRTARREAAELVVRRIREIAKDQPVILTGDFNVDQSDEIYQIFIHSGLLKDAYTTARIRFAENGSFNDFNSDLFTESRIDHVFVSPNSQVDAYGLLTNGYWTPNRNSDQTRKSTEAPKEISFTPYTRRLPSDHYPIFVRLKF